MTRIAQVVVVVLVVAFCFGQMAFAGEIPNHLSVKAIANSHPTGVQSNATEPANLYALWAGFTGSPFAYYATPTNSDGTEIWPCFGGGTANSNADCAQIGNPAQANYGLETGFPFYTWPLKISGNDFCDGAASTDLPCGQALNWFEDDAFADTTDHLLYIFTAVQGTAYIADTGTIDFGPTPAFTSSFIETIQNDTNFGTLGTAAGPNNGNCLASFNYPLAAASYPGTFGIAAGKTCVAPVTGVATLTTTAELGTPKYTKSTSPTVCGTVGPPCYTVKFTVAKTHVATQKFTIWLQ